MLIETSRLLLRPFATDDVDALHAHWTDREVRRYLWDGDKLSRARAAQLIDDSLASFSARRFGFWTLRTRDDGLFVGSAGLRSIQGGSPDVELIYSLAPSIWGRGLATEAARAVLRYGFKVLPGPIYAGTDAPNTRSVEVMRRLGMRYLHTELSGIFGGIVWYVISREEFDPRTRYRVPKAHATNPR